MNHEIQVFEILGKIEPKCRVFLTSGMEGSLHLLAKNLLITFLTREKKLSPMPLHNNFIIPPVLRKSRSRIKEQKYTSKCESCLVFQLFMVEIKKRDYKISKAFCFIEISSKYMFRLNL